MQILLIFLHRKGVVGFYLSQEAVDEHRSDLAEAVHPVHALHVVGGVPGRVKDDHPAGGH